MYIDIHKKLMKTTNSPLGNVPARNLGNMGIPWEFPGNSLGIPGEFPGNMQLSMSVFVLFLSNTLCIMEIIKVKLGKFAFSGIFTLFLLPLVLMIRV